MLAARNMTVKEGVIMSKISQAKAKSVTAESFAADVEDKLRERGRTSFEEMYPPEIIEKIAAETYIEYERLLRLNNSLDFDDLLLFGVKMFKAHRNAVIWCQHVLVDELYVLSPIHGLLMLIALKVKIQTLFNMTLCERLPIGTVSLSSAIQISQASSPLAIEMVTD